MTLYTNAQIAKVSAGNGTFAMGTPLQDCGPVKGNFVVDATRKIIMFKAGIPQILYKQIASDEDVFVKATLAAFDCTRLQQVLGVGLFTSVTAGNIPVTASVGFNDPDGNSNNIGELLGYLAVATSPAVVVKDAATGLITYTLNADYIFDYTDGMITRTSGSTIPASGAVTVAMTYAANAAEVYQFGGLNTVNYQPGQFIHTRPDGKRIIVDCYRCSTNGKWTMEFRETEYNLFDAQWNLIADLSRTAGNLYFQVRREI